MITAETWSAVTAIATVLAFIAAAIYAFLTYRSLEVTRAMLEREDKPLLRLSARKPGSPPTIRNFGRGVAFTTVILNPDKSVLRFFWTIGAGKRTDRGELPFDEGTTYLVYCQDMAGRWHLTTATPQGYRTRNCFHGIVRTREVPKVVLEQAQVEETE